MYRSAVYQSSSRVKSTVATSPSTSEAEKSYSTSGQVVVIDHRVPLVAVHVKWARTRDSVTSALGRLVQQLADHRMKAESRTPTAAASMIRVSLYGTRVRML